MNDTEKECRFDSARTLYADLNRRPAHFHAFIYGTIEHYIRRSDVFECLGVTVEEYTRARHAAFLVSGAHMLEKIRNGEVEYMEGLVNDIAGNEYSPAEISLPEDEFKEYAGIVALAIVNKTVRSVNHSWISILSILKSAGISGNEAVHARIINAAQEIPALSAFI